MTKNFELWAKFVKNEMSAISDSLTDMMFRITPLKPPGGDCHLTVGENSEGEEELKLHSKVTQPPGGSSSEIFSDSALDISTSSESSVVPPKKPYR